MDRHVDKHIDRQVDNEQKEKGQSCWFLLLYGTMTLCFEVGL